MQKIFIQIGTYLSGQYATVLIILGSVSLMTYFVLITDIKNQEGNARLVKMSTEQGQMVSDINFLLMEKIHNHDSSQSNKINAKIISDIQLLDQGHNSLSSGIRFVRESQQLVGIPGVLSENMRAIYFNDKGSLDVLMREYLAGVRSIYKTPTEELALDNKILRNLIFDLSPRLLEKN